jgi:hypothetical protein
MPRHRARVSETEVDVLDSVDVDEARTSGLRDEDGKTSRPLPHPVHRDALEQRRASALGELARPGMRLDEASLLAPMKLREGRH